MVFPIIGKLVSDVGMIINYAFIEKVPIELFFIEPVDSFFGGAAVFYLGKYRSRALKSRSLLRAAPSFLRLLYYIEI